MDPFALVGIVAVVGGLGYIAAAQKYGRAIRHLQQHMFSSSMESTTRCVNAAITTLTEDFKIDKDEATKKLFSRCAENGMVLKRFDPETGEAVAVNEEAPKS